MCIPFIIWCMVIQDKLFLIIFVIVLLYLLLKLKGPVGWFCFFFWVGIWGWDSVATTVPGLPKNGKGARSPILVGCGRNQKQESRISVGNMVEMWCNGMLNWLHILFSIIRESKLNNLGFQINTRYLAYLPKVIILK